MGEITSMAIELSIQYHEILKVVPEIALDFLAKLFTTSLKVLKNLKLSGFLPNGSLGALLSQLSLDWLHLICPLSGYGSFDPTSFPGFKKLHLKLKYMYVPWPFQTHPPLLEELSLHFSSLESFDDVIDIRDCKSLRKM